MHCSVGNRSRDFTNMEMRYNFNSMCLVNRLNKKRIFSRDCHICLFYKILFDKEFIAIQKKKFL